MKSVFVAVFAVVAMMVSTEGYAQQKKSMTPAEYGKATAEKMDEMLDLSDRQERKIAKLGKEYGEVFFAMREQTSLNIDVRRANVREAKAKLDNSLEDILSAEQFETYKNSAKKGGCCKSKANATQGGGCCRSKANATQGGGCCGSKATVSKESGCCGGCAKSAANGGGCCSGKDKATVSKESGCCGGCAKSAANGGGCCSGKDKAAGGGCCSSKATNK